MPYYVGQSVNAFGKHTARLKAFLSWAELKQDLPVHRHYRKFTVPSKQGRVAALDGCGPALHEQPTTTCPSPWPGPSA